jgi:hypothetical protein
MEVDKLLRGLEQGVGCGNWNIESHAFERDILMGHPNFLDNILVPLVSTLAAARKVYIAAKKSPSSSD